MPFNDFATEIESKPRSSDLTGACILCSYEAPKNTCLLLNGNADAPISNGEERHVWFDFFTNGQLDWSSLWTILDGILSKLLKTCSMRTLSTSTIRDECSVS